MGTSVHKAYFENIPEPVWDKYSQLKKELQEHYLVIDKTREKYPDSLFYRACHLNEYGAIRFTKEVLIEMNKEWACGNTPKNKSLA